MNKIYSISVLVLTIVALSSCINAKGREAKINVQHSGALKNIMSGNIDATISLDLLSNKNSLYALGAMENLKGEIQIFNSKVRISSVNNSNIKINESFNNAATLLVYAEVKVWESFKLPSTVLTKDDLENEVYIIAKEYGIDVEKPFPFLIEGQVSSLKWHVIDWKEEDSVHTHKKHKESGLNGVLNNESVEILGFYSTKHKAVFTHHTTNIHMHFITKNNIVAGHLDDLTLGNKIILKLPKK